MGYALITNFDGSLEVGKAGEALVQDFLRKKGYDILDLSEDKDWQSRGVDMRVTDMAGRSYFSDIKTDTECWATGNIILETEMYRMESGHMGPGWYVTSTMDILHYLCAGTGRLFVIDFIELKKLVDEGLGQFTRFLNPFGRQCIGEGILIDINELLRSSALISCEQIDASPLWKYKWRRGKPAPF